MIKLMRWYRDRLFEWIMALIMIGLAALLFLWPNAVLASDFRIILTIVSAEHMAVFFGVFGLLRAAALIANGSWPIHGPRLRAIGASSGALMWMQMTIALVQFASFNEGVPSPALPVYFALTIGEIVSAYRAMTDERTSPR